MKVQIVQLVDNVQTLVGGGLLRYNGESTSRKQEGATMEMVSFGSRTYTPCNRETLVEMVSSRAFKNAVKRVPEKCWGYRGQELTTMVRPTETDKALKGAFWNEIRLACALTGNQVDITRVYAGLCTYTHFYNNILGNPLKLAWLLAPSLDLKVAARSLLLPAMDRLHKLLELDIIKPNGQIDTKAARVVLQGISNVLLLNR